MSTARTRSIAARRDADMLEACADQQEALAAAKQAYADNPCEETLAARRQAMANMYAFRGFVRSVARLRRLRADLTSSRAAADPGYRAAIEAELRALEPTYGAFANGSQPIPAARPGDAVAEPKTIHGSARTNPVGGA